MGGDEFVLLLLGTDQSAIDERIDQLRQIEWHAGSGEGIDDQVSMSVGAAMFPQDGSDADEVLAEADRRMYKAKQAHKQERAFLAAGQSEAPLEMTTIQ
jgi:diguanylate cyclase (GGDEF)-like protein